MAKNNKKNTTSTINYGYFEYKMSKELATSYLSARKGEDKKKHPQEYLCQIVNNEFGIKGICGRVLY